MRQPIFFIAVYYMLYACTCSEKVETETIPGLTKTHWKLIELGGKPITNPTPTGKEMHIIFFKEGVVQGHGGCNSFRGKFEIKDGGRITITELAATLMACPDSENESSFFKAVESADNYIINGNFLQLNKAKMAPLARFEAVK